ncbi:hypothetical protein MAR_024692 [Mya arenaria]|uniref:Uncharacterized protein n=1 Tax=Mya arenaria TaxID=6604 RepID=A0ABY7DRI7_MYAAR|nr:uncharacterized protein LOC128229243 [Mya arenaria]WAR00320.1 hypothetical protein MAR_024692 [Mya arenaria]
MLRSKPNVGVVLMLVCAVCVLFVVMVRRPVIGPTSDCVPEPVYSRPVFLRSIDSSGDAHTLTLQETLKQQRDKLSKEINALKQKIGRQDCESATKNTNEAGGWCRKASTEDGGEHMTDLKLVKALSAFLKEKSVGSFGDGPGAYMREMNKLGEVREYIAYDGAPFCEETSEGRVRFMDLTVPQYGLPMYDWIISLEVAEHIPKIHEPIYIDNLVRHSNDGLILSWAKPGQGGLAHINNRPFNYVIDVMANHGFSHDKNSSHTLQMASSFGWLRDNVNVFRRTNTTNLKLAKIWYT